MGTEILSLGQVSQSVYLVISGAAYQFDYDQEGIEENILMKWFDYYGLLVVLFGIVALMYCPYFCNIF